MQGRKFSLLVEQQPYNKEESVRRSVGKSGPANGKQGGYSDIAAITTDQID